MGPFKSFATSPTDKESTFNRFIQTRHATIVMQPIFARIIWLNSFHAARRRAPCLHAYVNVRRTMMTHCVSRLTYDQPSADISRRPGDIRTGLLDLNTTSSSTILKRHAPNIREAAHEGNQVSCTLCTLPACPLLIRKRVVAVTGVMLTMWLTDFEDLTTDGSCFTAWSFNELQTAVFNRLCMPYWVVQYDP